MLKERILEAFFFSYWEGSISVAVYVKDDDLTFILDQIMHFCYCIPGMSRVSLHLVFP